MKKYLVSSFAVLLGLSVVGCGGGSGGDSPAASQLGAAEQDSAEIEGIAAKGIMAKAIIRAFRVDTGAEIGQTTTKQDGTYSLKLKYEGAVKLVATTDDRTLLTCDAVRTTGCGQFSATTDQDLNGNGIIDFGEQYQPGAGHFELVSFLPDVKRKDKIQSSITPITHIVWKLQEQSGDLSAAKYQSVFSQVNNLFGIDGDALARPVDITAQVAGPLDRNAMAHSAIVASIASWAYQQPEGFQNALDRFASILSSDSLVGNSSVALDPSLSGLMKDALVALEQMTVNNPGISVADIIAAFAIRQHIGDSLGGNLVSLPKPGVDYTASQTDRLNKGKSLVADMRTWASSIAEESSLRNAKYSERMQDMEEISNTVKRQQPLLEDAYRLFANPSNKVFSAVWNDIYSCLAAGAQALEAGSVLVQPATCPTVQLSSDTVILNGEIRNAEGAVIGDLEQLTLQKQNLADTTYNLSGAVSNQNAGVTLRLNSATWAYRLKPEEYGMPQYWWESTVKVEHSSFEADMELADHQSGELQTRFKGTWTMNLQEVQENEWDVYPQVISEVEGELTSPNGTLAGKLSVDLTKMESSYHANYRNFNNTRNLVSFTGKLTNISGETIVGSLTLGSHLQYVDRYRSESYYSRNDRTSLDAQYLNVALSGVVTSQNNTTFEGSVRLKLLEPFYNDSEYDYSYWGWSYYSKGTSASFGLDLIDAEGKITTASESYRLRAYLDVHNPDVWVVNANTYESGNEWYSNKQDWTFYRQWSGPLEESETDFVRFSATLVFEETLSGRESTWASLSVDRTGFKQGNAQLRLSSHQGNDWRSLTATYNSALANEPGINSIHFGNQNGASLAVDFLCEQPGQTLFESCQFELDNLTGKLHVEGQEVGKLKVLDNRLIKVTYIDGQFETLQ